MPVRLSGMVSGLDTDSVVKALMSAQTYKKTKIEASKQKLEWKKELWSEMNTKIYDFYKSTLSKMRLQSTFKTKTATSSDASKITATAGSAASEGTYRIKVKSIASAQFVTSGELGLDGSGNKVSTSTKLSELKDSELVNKQIQFTAGDGKEALLNVDENTTISDFLSAAKSAGLNATYDTTQNRFFISSANSGKDQKFSIQAVSLDEDHQSALTEWRTAIGYDSLSKSDQDAVNKIFNNLQLGKVEYDVELQDKLEDYLGNARKTKITSYFQEQIKSQIADKYSTSELTEEEQEKEIEKELKAAMESESVLDAIEAAVLTGVVDIETIEDGENRWEIENPADDDWLSTSLSVLYSHLQSSTQNYAGQMEMDEEYLSGNTASDALNSMGLEEITGEAKSEGDDNPVGMVVVKAEDASITLNGATLTSSNSTFSVNGLTLNVLDQADSDVVITVGKDSAAVYDTIKDFISEYNTILKSMNTSYKAGSAKGYSVLTKEMKEEMTDDEVEKWENMIKSSLLRRDDTLNSLISGFRTNMMSSYTASDGKKYSLASLGIMTSTDYTEGGLLHIKGDEDDSIYADSENKLQKMLDEDPDLVMEIMNGITGKLYEDLTKKMRTTTNSSSLTFYNDKLMTKQVEQYKKDITTWEKKLAEMEERYYKQFSAMEKAMSNLQSQQNSLSGLFG